MNKQQFMTWINDPASLDEEGISGLHQLVTDYPYFQAARVLHLLNLKRMKDYRFEPELRRVAAYAADRARLREWLGYIEEQGSPVEDQLSKRAHLAHAIIRSKEDPRLKNLEDQIRESLLEIEKEKSRLFELLEEKKAIAADSVIPEDEYSGPEKEPAMRPLPKDDLLDEFIRDANNRGFKRAAFYNPEESAKRSILENEGIVSETLARLVAAQGKKDKAIEIYQKLMLKNPQKSSYFAAQIEKLRKEL
jgi:hypothetical protein